MDDTSKKQIRTFGYASFLNDFGSDMIYPFWPIFLTTVLGAPMSVVGLIDGLGDAIVSLSQAFSGYYSDKIGRRKPFIWLGYLFAGTARIGYAFAPVWQWIIPFRVLDRFGKMRGSPRNAIVANLSTDANRGANFGYLRMMDNAGAVCGVLVSIVLLKYIGYHALFLIAAIPSCISALLIFTRITEKATPDKPIWKGVSFAHFEKNTLLFLKI